MSARGNVMPLGIRALMFVGVALLFTLAGRILTATQALSSPGSWLERPLSGWNKAGAVLPKATLPAAARERLLSRCGLTLLKSTSPERVLGDAGWIPFWNVDQKLVQADLEIVNGMTGADGMCRPTGYNIFVFVAGRFAGALSPVAMSSREDASSGAVRILDADRISAEFVRYTEKDPLCCPSSRVTVRYRIDRSGTQPVVVPVDVRTTRQL